MKTFLLKEQRLFTIKPKSLNLDDLKKIQKEIQDWSKQNKVKFSAKGQTGTVKKSAVPTVFAYLQKGTKTFPATLSIIVFK